MKTYNLISASSWLNTLISATVILTSTAITAKAQSVRGSVAPLPSNVTNGLFAPTQSQRFFQNGREAFEKEVEIFNQPQRYWDNDVLQFDRESIEQMNLLEANANSNLKDFQQELRLDSINH